MLAALTGGPAAALAVDYSRPNRRYGYAEAARQGQLANVNQQIGDLDKQNEEQQKNYTGRLNTAKEAVTLEKNEDTAAARAETNRVRQEQQDTREKYLDLKQQQLDGQMPKTYEQTVVAAAMEKDPVKKAQLQSAINTMEAMEVKKFKYAAKSNGDLSTPLRQSMVDKATQDISDLQDDYDYDPETGTYISKKDQKPITPLQFTDMKNTVATKLDQQLTQKKMKPLGVRFSVSDASWHDAQGLGRNAGKAGVAPETLNAPEQQQSQQSAAAPTQVPLSTTSNMPPQSVIDGMKEGQYVHGNGVSYQKKNGQLVEVSSGSPDASSSQLNRPKATTSADGLSVNAPNGKTYNFKTPEAAAKFRQEAGLQEFTIQDGGGKPLTDVAVARKYLAAAGGDKDKARQLAIADNWKF